MASISSRRDARAESLTSRFYAAETVDQKLRSFLATRDGDSSQPRGRTRQSRHLPLWAWALIAGCHGLAPAPPRLRPLPATLLHALTLGSALALAVACAWYEATAVLRGPGDAAPSAVVRLLLLGGWCGFGAYCKRLGGRLLRHRRFLEDVRLHARSVFGLNGALVLAVLGAAFAAAHLYVRVCYFGAERCTDIDLAPVVCHLARAATVAFTLLTLLWYCIVSGIFVSVCRTHTIGLRRFIRELEYDASSIERHLSFTHNISPLNQDDIWQESLWLAQDESDDEYDKLDSDTKHPVSDTQQQGDPNVNGEGRPRAEISILLSPFVEDNPPYACSEGGFDGEKVFVPNPRPPRENEAYVMSNSELMHHFWKLNCRLRFSSCALQRWYASFVALVLLRCSTYLVHWLGHPATFVDILQFSLVLVLLIVLSTAIAEVNFEGQRAMRCIYPTEKRIRTLQYMALNPPQISVYGFGITHGTIVAVVFSMLVVFVTKILITEMTK